MIAIATLFIVVNGAAAMVVGDGGGSGGEGGIAITTSPAPFFPGVIR